MAEEPTAGIPRDPTVPPSPGAPPDDLDVLGVNTLRGLAIDAIQKANSGHPGMPMGMADVAWVLWTRYLAYDPDDPAWPDRDRFVLSAGHGSMLLYGLLHLAGLGLELDDLESFRQLHSRTAGHPEYGEVPMVETTTGPLGQGFANAVGMAMAERLLRERFGSDLCDHHTWVMAGDGDLMEGVVSETASLAGHLGLGRLVVFYDDNQITIDGSTQLAFSEDRAGRFEAMGWHAQIIDGHDHGQIAEAIEKARADPRPSIICCRTVIGQGSPNKAGKAQVHGAPLGPQEVRLTKQQLGLDPDARFAVPEAVVSRFRRRDDERRSRAAAWQERLRSSELRSEWERWQQLDPTDPLAEVSWPRFEPGGSVATRKASGQVIAAVAERVPQLVGGSADLAASCKTLIPGAADLCASDFCGRNIHFGIREHGMAAICSGLALHGGLIPYCSTFLVFHDYMRPAVRLAAMMRQGVIYVYTHDSIFVGEDGPTHQPVEQLQAMRLIPGLVTLRPADATETAEAWRVALERRDGPTALVLTRQGLPVLDREAMAPASDLRRGGYVLRDLGGAPRCALLASGSEVHLALGAQEQLHAEGIATRVVNLASWELFDAQDAPYRDGVLPPDLPRVALEAGRTLGWSHYLRPGEPALGIDRFGLSAPGAQVAEALGLSVANVIQAVKALIGS